MSSHTLYTVRNFVRRFLPKHGKKLGQKVASVRWGNSLPIFGSRFHHTMIKQISIVETWWNRVPNVSRMFHHLMEATFWPSFFTMFWWNVEKKNSNSYTQLRDFLLLVNYPWTSRQIIEVLPVNFCLNGLSTVRILLWTSYITFFFFWNCAVDLEKN